MATELDLLHEDIHYCERIPVRRFRPDLQDLSTETTNGRCPLYEGDCGSKMVRSEGVCKGDYESCPMYKQKQEFKK